MGGEWWVVLFTWTPDGIEVPSNVGTPLPDHWGPAILSNLTLESHEEAINGLQVTN